MPSNKVLEQHIAVFGESGSGKTVMLSSFYGSEQEPQNIKKGTFNVVAENAGQGTHLHQNYLGMKNSATVPGQNRFAAMSYRFLLRLKGGTEAKPLKTSRSTRSAWSGTTTQVSGSSRTSADRRRLSVEWRLSERCLVRTSHCCSWTGRSSSTTRAKKGAT